MIFFFINRYLRPVVWAGVFFLLSACEKENTLNDPLVIHSDSLSKNPSCKKLTHLHNLCKTITQLKMISENKFVHQNSYSKQNIQNLVYTFQKEQSQSQSPDFIHTLFELKVILVGGTNHQLTLTELNHLLDYIFFIEDILKRAELKKILFVLDENLSVSDFKSKTAKNSETFKILGNFISRILDQIKKYHENKTIFSYLKEVSLFVKKYRKELLSLENEIAQLTDQNTIIPIQLHLDASGSKKESIWSTILNRFPTENEIETAHSVFKLLEKDERPFRSLKEIFLKMKPEERKQLIQKALDLFFLWDQFYRYVLSVEISFRSSNWDLNQNINYKISNHQEAHMIHFFDQIKEVVEKAYEVAQLSILKRNPPNFKNEEITKIMENIFKILNEENKNNSKESRSLTDHQRDLLGLVEGGNTFSPEGKRRLQSWEKIHLPLSFLDLLNRPGHESKDPLFFSDLLKTPSHQVKNPHLLIPLNTIGFLKLEALKQGFDSWYDTQNAINQHFLSLNQNSLQKLFKTDLSKGQLDFPLNQLARILTSSYCYENSPFCTKNFVVEDPGCYNGDFLCTKIFALPLLWRGTSNQQQELKLDKGFEYSFKELSFLNFYSIIFSIFFNNDYFINQTSSNGKKNIVNFFKSKPLTSYKLRMSLRKGNIGKCELGFLFLNKDQSEKNSFFSKNCIQFLKAKVGENFELKMGELSFLNLVFEEKETLLNLYDALITYADLFLPSSNGDGQISVSETTQMALYLYSAQMRAKQVKKEYCRLNSIQDLDCDYEKIKYVETEEIFWNLISEVPRKGDTVIENASLKQSIKPMDLIGKLNQFLKGLKNQCTNQANGDGTKCKFELFKIALESWFQKERNVDDEEFKKTKLNYFFMVLYFLETFFLKWNPSLDGSIKASTFLNIISKMPEIKESLKNVCLPKDPKNDEKWTSALRELKEILNSRWLSLSFQSTALETLEDSWFEWTIPDSLKRKLNRIDVLEIGHSLTRLPECEVRE